ncbi:MAG: riboflavin synthase [Balneolaceae bacterium]
MFTGIISEVGKIQAVTDMPGGCELQIGSTFSADTHEDESISVNGVCLTVVELSSNFFRVQCVDETLRKTTLGDLKEGDPVNLERSLTLQKAIEGHIVQGHVDTVATIKSIEQKKDHDRLVTVSYPEQYIPYIVGRGSIAIDGISMTVAREERSEFTVAVIPYTWNHTNLKSKQEGDRVNLEFDIFGKYIVRYLDKRFDKEREKG